MMSWERFKEEEAVMRFAGKSPGERAVAIEFRANGMHNKMKGPNGGVRCIHRSEVH